MEVNDSDSYLCFYFMYAVGTFFGSLPTRLHFVPIAPVPALQRQSSLPLLHGLHLCHINKEKNEQKTLTSFTLSSMPIQTSTVILSEVLLHQ